jgi:hypothetical protein
LTGPAGWSKLGLKMKRATLLTVLFASALAFGQKFDVSDLSASDRPISFTGTTKVLKAGTACVVTAHNNSSRSLLAVRVTADAATRYQWDQPVTFEYDGFFKESGIAPGLDFDVVDESAYSVVERVVILKAGKEILRQQVERDYVALRDPAPVSPMENAAGMFTWNGSYVKPKNENRFEVFVSSTRDPRLAMNAKARYEALGLSYSGKGTVMVVRPPLRANPSYGLVLGLIQPTQQVQFTFAKEEAEAVCKCVRVQANLAGTKGLLRPNVYLYDNYTNGCTPCR